MMYDEFFDAQGLGNCFSPLYTAVPSISAASTSRNEGYVNTGVSYFKRKWIIPIAVIIPTLGIATLIFLIIMIRRHRKRKQAELNQSSAITPTGRAIFGSGKPEMEAKSRVEGELDSQELQHEIDPATERYEMAGSDVRHEVSTEEPERGLLSLRLTHEFRGEEHAKEMDVLESGRSHARKSREEEHAREMDVAE